MLAGPLPQMFRTSSGVPEPRREDDVYIRVPKNGPLEPLHGYKVRRHLLSSVRS
jgi:hypothetical protein